MAENKVLLSVKDLVVKFRVRGRILTAIRNISLDIRYLLFNIEHIGHAEYLFNEMVFVK